MDELPPALAGLLRAELDPDEPVLWRARPRSSRLFVRSLGRGFPGVLFLASTVFFFVGPRGNDPGHTTEFLFFPGSVFILIGTVSMLSPFWSIWKGRRSVYAVTDRRALIIEAAFRHTVQSFAGDKLVNATRREMSGGYGDLVLDQIVTTGGKGGPRYRKVGFFGIDDVRKVNDLLRDVYKRVYRPGNG